LSYRAGEGGVKLICMSQRISIGVLCAVCALCTSSIASADDTPPPPSPFHSFKRIVFVCDASDTMAPKMKTLRSQLNISIDHVPPDGAFNIIFMRDNSCAKVADELLPATPANKERAKKFISDFKPGGKTDPMPALKASFRGEPQLVYLLADHAFREMDQLPARIAELNHDRKVKVNTIAFVGDDDNDTEFQKVLAQIAKENNGVYKFVKAAFLEGK
jgi:hypothetical protein